MFSYGRLRRGRSEGPIPTGLPIYRRGRGFVGIRIKREIFLRPDAAFAGLLAAAERDRLDPEGVVWSEQRTADQALAVCDIDISS
jgi:hypothetical protein